MLSEDTGYCKSLQKSKMHRLHEETLSLVKEERRLTGLIIENLRKIADSKMYLEMGYSSLFLYCTQALGYSEAAAYRRVEAVKVLRAVPEVRDKLNEGTVNLTTLTLAQRVFKTANASVDEKREAIAKIENCSKTETEKVLADLFNIEAPETHREQIRYFRGEEASLKIVVTAKLLEKLDRIKSLRSHINPNMSYAEVIEDVCDLVLKRIDPLTDAQNKITSATKKVTEKQFAQDSGTFSVARTGVDKNGSSRNPRYIPPHLNREIWQRDEGRCTYKDPNSGRRCASRHLLQIDHIKPLLLGGETSRNNLRLLCHAHHRFRDTEF